MVERVKKDEEVSLEYMKIFEREQMLINQGIKEGRLAEQQNTERERIRADKAEAELQTLKKSWHSSNRKIYVNKKQIKYNSRRKTC